MIVDLVVIGAGPAGLAAALEAKRAGLEDILIIERDKEPGGILQQCIHNGFGLHIFKEELTGPEYAQKFIDAVYDAGIKILLNTMVLSLTNDKQIVVVSPTEGFVRYEAKAVILAMGCRERTRGALQIPGSRPAGVITAGAAQRFVNMEGYLPGKGIVILGSGDIGLIMARRLTLEGAKVKLVCEIMPYSGGLNRNIVQCLNDFDIPLLLNTTVVKIHGNERITGVTIAQVDEERRPLPESFEYVDCDTLILSVGLIPENELSVEAGIIIDAITQGPIVDSCRETSVEGIYACGNVVHVHDLVDNVTEEAQLAGRFAAKAILDGEKSSQQAEKYINTVTGKGVRYIVPQRIKESSIEDKVSLFFRTDKDYTNKNIVVRCADEILFSKRKKKLAPGEMETINLPEKLFSMVPVGGNLTVSIE